MSKKIFILIVALVLVAVLAVVAWRGFAGEGLFTPPDNADIRSLNIVPNQKITSPVTITGELKGTWFFEASFPVFIVDWDGRIIAQGEAQSQSNWMTTDFVPFEITLIFDKPTYKNNGAVIFKKDNPSGLPANDAAYEMPILFSD